MIFKKNLLNIFVIMVIIIASISVLIATHVISINGMRFVFSTVNIRISTVITGIVCFGLVLFLQGRILWKPLYYAILVVVFFLSLYEIVWYYLAAFSFGYELRIFQFAALGGWVLLGAREVYPRKPPKVSLMFYVFFVAIMVVWVATGFEVNSFGDAKFSIAGEVFNEASKAALALGFAVHIGTKKS
jgi:hypothetical protein